MLQILNEEEMSLKLIRKDSNW